MRTSNSEAGHTRQNGNTPIASLTSKDMSLHFSGYSAHYAFIQLIIFIEWRIPSSFALQAVCYGYIFGSRKGRVKKWLLRLLSHIKARDLHPKVSLQRWAGLQQHAFLLLCDLEWSSHLGFGHNKLFRKVY